MSWLAAYLKLYLIGSCIIAAGYRIDDNDNWYRRYDTQGNKITTDKFGCNKYTRDDIP